MRKLALFLTLSCLTFAAYPAFAQQPDWDKVQIKTQKLTDNTYLLQGAGGNITAFVGQDEIVLVDCEFLQLGPKIQAALKTISDKPVKYLFNTHWHADHSGADAYFAGTAVIIAQENVRKRMEADPRLSKTPLALPGVTFSHELTLHTPDGDLQAIYFPEGHTNGDSAVFLPGAKVVATGDDFSKWDPPHFPSIDRDGDGSGGVQGEIAAAEYVLAHTPGDVKIVPGHGDLATKTDLAQYLAILKDTSAVVRQAMRQGKSLDQMKKEKILAKWQSLEVPDNPGAMKSDVYLEHLYRSLSAENPAANLK
jgi:cyclase